MGRALRWTESELSQVQAKRAPVEPIKPSKYRNKKTAMDGLTFDSTKEARRYVELKNMQQAGIISNLRMQVPIECKINGIKVCTWIADFTYADQGGKPVYEDVKGFKTDVYRLKKKLVEANCGITIREF